MESDRSMFADLTRKGAMEILYIAGTHGTTRYTELQSHLTISDPTIGKRLNELVGANLLVRTFDEERAPRVDYSLSQTAQEVYEPLAKLFEWVAERAEINRQPTGSNSIGEPEVDCVCCGAGSIAKTSFGDGDREWYRTVPGLVDVISKTYAMRTLYYLQREGPSRYNDLRDWLEVTSDTALSNRLDNLEEAGLITRQSYDEIPPHVEYSLTRDGQELAELVEPILEWAERPPRRR